MHAETQEQLALMEWARYVRCGSFWLNEVLVHVPNGGKRGKIEAAIFQGMGVKRGFPDLMLPAGTRDFKSAAWELKSTDGALSAHQIKCHEMLRYFGWYVATFNDWQLCSQDILRYLALPGAPKSIFGLSVIQPAMEAAKRTLPYRPAPRQRRSR